MPQEKKNRRVNNPAGARRGEGEGRGTHNRKNVPECSATCMVCGGGEGGRGEKWADVARGGKERGGCGERVQERARWCDDNDGGVL